MDLSIIMKKYSISSKNPLKIKKKQEFHRISIEKKLTGLSVFPKEKEKIFIFSF
jgi:hypothetical protein